MKARDDEFRGALRNLFDAAGARRSVAMRDAVRLAISVLAAPRAVALRDTPGPTVDDAQQVTLMQFFADKALARLEISTAPQLIRTIFRRRVKDQRRGAWRYVYSVLQGEDPTDGVSGA